VLVTVYGVLAVSFMMLMYAFEGRGKVFTLGFAAGCVLSGVYGFLAGAWPFGIVELVWAGVALRRYQRRSHIEHGSTR
jgi:hypothetical protein